jgi:hypothetical protein
MTTHLKLENFAQKIHKVTAAQDDEALTETSEAGLRLWDMVRGWLPRIANSLFLKIGLPKDCILDNSQPSLRDSI